MSGNFSNAEGGSSFAYKNSIGSKDLENKQVLNQNPSKTFWAHEQQQSPTTQQSQHKTKPNSVIKEQQQQQQQQQQKGLEGRKEEKEEEKEVVEDEEDEEEDYLEDEEEEGEDEEDEEDEEEEDDGNQEIVVKILVHNSLVGSIIGKAGMTIKEVSATYSVQIKLSNEENVSNERVLTIVGKKSGVLSAQRSIFTRLQAEHILDVLKENEEMSQIQIEETTCMIPLKLLVPANFIGRLIGKSGLNMKRIMLESNSFIQCTKEEYLNERVVTVVGSIVSFLQAEDIILSQLRVFKKQQLLTSKISSVSATSSPASTPSSANGSPGNSRSIVLPYGSPFPGADNQRPIQVNQQYDIVYLYIPNGVVGNVIGKGGSTVKDISKQSKTTITIAKSEAYDPKDGFRPAIIEGTIENIFKAQTLVYGKITEAPAAVGGGNDHHLKVEIVIQNEMAGRVIGKKGSQIKNISNLSGCRLTMKESEDAYILTIIGRIDNNIAAQQAIRDIIHFYKKPEEN